MAGQSARRPASGELRRAIERAEAALALVTTDVEATTAIREPGKILRYGDWILEGARDPRSWLLDNGDPEGNDELLADDDDELACQFGGYTFLLHGDQSTAEMAVDIAYQVQDDVTHEVWAAWPRCPGHPHPMSPAIAGGTAVWTCPSDSDVTRPIGQLPARPTGSP